MASKINLGGRFFPTIAGKFQEFNDSKITSEKRWSYYSVSGSLTSKAGSGINALDFEVTSNSGLIKLHSLVVRTEFSDTVNKYDVSEQCRFSVSRQNTANADGSTSPAIVIINGFDNSMDMGLMLNVNQISKSVSLIGTLEGGSVFVKTGVTPAAGMFFINYASILYSPL